MAMRWYQHNVHGTINMTSPMNKAPKVDTKAMAQALSKYVQPRFIGGLSAQGKAGGSALEAI